VKRTVLITGASYRGSADPSGSSVFSDPLIKPNIGACIAKSLADGGFNLILVSRNSAKLATIKRSLEACHADIDILLLPADLTNLDEASPLAASLPTEGHLDVVHSAGLGAGDYKIPNDNPYLPVTETPAELPTLEFDAAVRTLLNLTKTMLPRIANQADPTRFVVISSMSGIRAYRNGYAHASAKAGVHHAVRTLALELAPLGIYVTEVNPGIVKTGLYDSEAVKDTTVDIARDFGYQFERDSFPQLAPSAIGDVVQFIMRNSGHILTVNVVPFGQYPHTGS
jgi:NAD(P)-dependent dehydrogenase (short-subunit alcohol dehydrogenase family)